MIIVGVDMGVKYHALAALHEDGTLWLAALIPHVEALLSPTGRGDNWRLVIERAHARPEDGRTKLREVDALNLAAGRVGARHPAPEFVTTSQWKGSVSKAIDQERTLSLLSPKEREILPKSKAELKHVLDAVGIALWAAGRKVLDKGRPGFVGGPGPGSAPEQK